MFDRIVLSVDVSEDSDKAVRATRDLASRHGSQVVVVQAEICPWSPRTHRRLRGWRSGRPTRMRIKAVDAAVSQLRAAGVGARGQVLPGQGRIGNRILQAADADAADLIVLGSRGMSRIQEIAIGSATNKIIRSADRPVLLVR